MCHKNSADALKDRPLSDSDLTALCLLKKTLVTLRKHWEQSVVACSYKSSLCRPSNELLYVWRLTHASVETPFQRCAAEEQGLQHVRVQIWIQSRTRGRTQQKLTDLKECCEEEWEENVPARCANLTSVLVESTLLLVPEVSPLHCFLCSHLAVVQHHSKEMVTTGNII